jgi:hypothetical protein
MRGLTRQQLVAICEAFDALEREQAVIANSVEPFTTVYHEVINQLVALRYGHRDHLN